MELFRRDIINTTDAQDLIHALWFQFFGAFDETRYVFHAANHDPDEKGKKKLISHQTTLDLLDLWIQ